MLFKFGKLATVGVVALGLSACAQLYNQGMDATSNGPAFNDALTAKYQMLAKWEANEQDWVDADFFGQRALLTAGGDAPDPQALGDRDIPEMHLGELTDARGQLMAALDGGARTRETDGAAEAQAGFDCWMQEAEENIQPEDIQRCKDMFWAGMAKLKVEPPKAMPKPKPKPAPVAMGPWVVYFDFDSSTLRGEGEETVADAASSASRVKGSKMLLTAHTDTSGSDSYNLDLSARRGKSVVDEFGGFGIAGDRITVSAVGESDPAVATGDGVREQANRRVEIRLVK